MSNIREIKFEGALTPDTFKQFFLIYDALLPLEWRINYLYDGSLLDFGNYFERIICRDDILDLDSWYIDHSFEMYISFRLTEQWKEQLAELDEYDFKGIDELYVPIALIEENDDLLEALSDMETDIRRIDVETPIYGYKVDKSVYEYKENFEKEGVQFFIISLFDPTYIDNWYSKPDYEGLVDPLPEPYLENGKRYSVTSDALYYEGGFRLNLQDVYYTQRRKAFVDNFDPYKLLPQLLQKKISYYKECRRGIKAKDGNIYWGYFNWVAKNIKVNEDYNFVPNFMLKPHSFYYKALVENGIFNHSPQGLLLSETKNIIPIVEVKK